jgi:hypothetical protein
MNGPPIRRISRDFWIGVIWAAVLAVPIWLLLIWLIFY